MKKLMMIALTMLNVSAYAGNCEKFVGKYSNAGLKLEILVENKANLLSLIYSIDGSEGIYSYIPDGINHEGDGGHTGRPYNVSCTDTKIVVHETFGAHIFIRDIVKSGPDIIQSGYIDNQAETPIRFLRVP